jgi:hypothetical protein
VPRLGYDQIELTIHGLRSTASTAPGRKRQGSKRMRSNVNLRIQEANEIRGAYTHAAEFWQERCADDAVVGGRVRPAKGARSCHENECLRKSAFNVGLLP